MTHRFNEEELTAYVLGELEAGRLAAVEQAIAADPELRRTVAELQATAELAGAALGADGSAGLRLTDEQRRAVQDVARAAPAAGDKTKVVCESCGAKYSIATAKVAGKVLKIRCKKCGEGIVIRGDAGPEPAAAAPSPVLPGIAAGAEDDDDAETRVFDYSGYQAGEPAAVWHIAVDGEQQGPYTGAQLGEFLAAGSIGPETLVWQEGFADWRPCADVAELSAVNPAVAPTEPGPGGGLFDAGPPAADPEGGLFDAPVTAGEGGGLFDFGGDGGGLFDAPAGDPRADLFAAASGGDDDLDDVFSSAAGGSPSAAAGGLFAPEPTGPRVSADQAMLTGQRNENSVLFSLTNLQALASAGAAAGDGVGPLGGGTSGGDEASGLIDIRSMASATALDGDAGGVDDLLSIGGGGFAPSLGAPVLAAAPSEGMSTGLKIGIATGGLAAAACLVVVLVLVLRSEPEPPPAAANDAQLAALVAEIAKLKAGGGAGTDEVAALEKKLEAEQAGKAGTEAGDEGSGGDEQAEDDKDDKGGKGKTSGKGGTKTSAGTAKDKGKTGGGGGGTAKAGAEDLAGGGSSGKTGGGGGKKNDELDDLLGGSAKAPPKKKDPPAGGGGGGGGGGGAPDKLSRAQVQAGMNAVAGSVKACGQGAGGSVTVSVVIAPTGRVTSASPVGAHAGTPVGQCAARAVRRARFPQTKSSLSVKYPFKL